MAEHKQQVACVFVGLLIGVITMSGYLAITRAVAPASHDQLIKAIMMYMTWPVGSETLNGYCFPTLLTARTGMVGTVLNVIDLRDIVLRSRMYGSVMPESIWAWTFNGTTVAIARILGPITISSYGDVWYVEISRLTMAQLTIYLPDGTPEVMSMPFGRVTPVEGYSPHFYDINGTRYQEIWP